MPGVTELLDLKSTRQTLAKYTVRGNGCWRGQVSKIFNDLAIGELVPIYEKSLSKGYYVARSYPQSVGQLINCLALGHSSTDVRSRQSLLYFLY